MIQLYSYIFKPWYVLIVYLPYIFILHPSQYNFKLYNILLMLSIVASFISFKLYFGGNKDKNAKKTISPLNKFLYYSAVTLFISLVGFGWIGALVVYNNVSVLLVIYLISHSLYNIIFLRYIYTKIPPSRL